MAANNLITPTWVMKQVGLRLVNNWRFANNVNRSYDDQYKQNGAKMGYTVNARLPQRYKVNSGQAINPQAVDDKIVPITLTDQKNVAIEFSTSSLTMEVDNYRERYLEPAVDALINEIDGDGLRRSYLDVFWTVGTPGVTPGTEPAPATQPQAGNNVYMSAVTKLADNAVPTNDLKAMLSPGMHQGIVSANFALFNPAANISRQYKTGRFGTEALGIGEWFMDQNVPMHTIGPLGGTPLINGVTLDGATALVTDGWTAGVGRRLNKGDVIQVAGVFSVNPQSYTSNGVLQDFVVTANVDSDGAGNATIPVSPALILAGPNQTVSALPIDNAALSIFGAAAPFTGLANKPTRQGLVYHMDSFALVMADLELPGGVWVAERISNRALGIAVRFVKGYDIMSDQSPARLDVIYGWKAVRPELAARVAA
jgi:hypothetical protein